MARCVRCSATGPLPLCHGNATFTSRGPGWTWLISGTPHASSNSQPVSYCAPLVCDTATRVAASRTTRLISSYILVRLYTNLYSVPAVSGH